MGDHWKTKYLGKWEKRIEIKTDFINLCYPEWGIVLWKILSTYFLSLVFILINSSLKLSFKSVDIMYDFEYKIK